MSKSFYKSHIIILTILFLFCLLTPISQVKAIDDTYVISEYNEKNGLPTGEANTILQTSDGYIWIGSYGGLIRYDGMTFRNYSNEGMIDSCSIRTLFEDSRGRLWIGTNDEGIYMMEKDQFTHIEIPEDRSFLCIRDFAEGQNGEIYVASSSGIAQVQDQRLSPFSIREINHNMVYSLSIDTYGRIWGILNSGRCVVIKDGQLIKTFQSREFFDKAEIYCLTNDSSGNMILGTDGHQIGIVHFLSEELNKKNMKINYYDTQNVTTHNNIVVNNQNDILICGLQGFGILDHNQHFTEFDDKQKAMGINSAITDYEGNIWLASSNYGVIKYSQGCFTSPNEIAKLEDTPINCIAKDNQYYYIGTDTEFIVCHQDFKRVNHKLSQMLKGVRIRHIFVDHLGQVWIASYSDNPVIRYQPKEKKIKVFNSQNGLTNSSARVIYELSDGRIAVGTQSGLYIIKDNQVIKSYDQQDGLKSAILCINETSQGHILVGTDGNGIYEISDQHITNYSYNDGLEKGVVLRLLKDGNEGFFISAGSDLYYWNQKQFKKLNNYDKEAGSIFDFYERDGNLWLLQNNGILSINKEKLLNNEKVDTTKYSFNQGLTGSLNANTWSYLSPEGNLYMPTRNGISCFSFKNLEHQSFKIIINQVKADNQIIEHPQELNLNSHINRLTISYAILSYTDTSNIKISYQLKGFDDKETIIDNQKTNSISYTNLKGGKYTLELRVYDAENPHHQQTISLIINKEKKVTEQPMFWIIILSLFIGSIIFISRLQINHARKRQMQYKKIVEDSLLCFAKTIDAKDKYTNGHSTRVAQYSREIAKRMGLSEQEQENIYYMALLHDIGKIGIPDYVLNKPGKLTDEERKLMQMHPSIGGDILKDFTALDGIEEGARYHHERYDGQGYCEGLKGTEIPQYARIIAVADAFDAMSSDRCYRKALSIDIIKEELKKGIGHQFDPEVVPHMLDMIEEGLAPLQDD